MKKIILTICTILLLFCNFSIVRAESGNLSFDTCKPVNKTYSSITGQTLPLLENPEDIYELPDESVFGEKAPFIVNDNDFFDNVRYGWMFCPEKNRRNQFNSSKYYWEYKGLNMSTNNETNAPKIYFDTLKESTRVAKNAHNMYLVRENTVNINLNTNGGKVEGYEDNIYPFTYYIVYLPTITNVYNQPQTKFVWVENNCDPLPTPIRPGYVFNGWFITYDDGSILHNGDTDYQLTKKTLLDEIDLASSEINAKNNQRVNFRESTEIIATWKKISDDSKIGIKCGEGKYNSVVLSDYYTIPDSQSKKEMIDEDAYIMTPDFVIKGDDELTLPTLDNISIQFANHDTPNEYKFDGWYAKREQQKNGEYVYSEKLEKINKDNLSYLYTPRNQNFTKYCDFIVTIYPKWIDVTPEEPNENEVTNKETIDEPTEEIKVDEEIANNDTDDNNKEIDEKDSAKSTDNTVTPQTKEIKNPESQGVIVTPTSESDDVKIEIAKITGLKAVNKKGKKISLKWKKLNDVKKYEVQISTKKNMKKVKRYTTSKNTCAIKKLKKNKTYYVRVRGVNDNNVGIWSKTIKIKIKK